MGYKVAQIEELQLRLEKLPEINDAEREVTKQEAIRRMAGTIALLQERGYSIERIAEVLTTGGITISVQTLKSYLTRAKKPAKARMRRKLPTKSVSPSTSQDAKPDKSSSSSKAKPSKDAKDGSSPGARSSSFEPRQDSTEI